MSYTNQNNIYGARPFQSKSDYETNGLNYKNAHPIQAIEDSMQNLESSVSYDDGGSWNKGGQNKCGPSQDNCKCNNPTPSCPSQPKQCGCEPKQCECKQQSKPCGCEQQSKPCGCEQKRNDCDCKPKRNDCDCHNHRPDTDDCTNTCIPSNNCCNGQTCTFDQCKATCVCTQMNVIFDEDTANGPTIFQAIVATVPNFTITSEFTQLGQCCNACAIDGTSVFTIDNVRTTIKSFVLQTPTIATTNVLIGGKPALSVAPDNGGFNAVVDPSVINELCTCKGKGTKSNVLINGLANWNYIARYEFCGKVTTNGTTCNFRIIAENTSTNPSTIPDSLTFISSDICLPESKPSEAVVVNIHFIGKGQLVNPVITVVGGPSPAPTTITVGGNLMFNAQAELTVVKNTKVCIQGMVQ